MTCRIIVGDYQIYCHIIVYYTLPHHAMSCCICSTVSYQKLLHQYTAYHTMLSDETRYRIAVSCSYVYFIWCHVITSLLALYYYWWVFGWVSFYCVELYSMLFESIFCTSCTWVTVLCSFSVEYVRMHYRTPSYYMLHCSNVLDAILRHSIVAQATFHHNLLRWTLFHDSTPCLPVYINVQTMFTWFVQYQIISSTLLY